MRVEVDREGGALRLALGETAGARRVAVAAGVAVLLDAADRLVGLDLDGVDRTTLTDVTLALVDHADRLPGGPATPPLPATAATPLPPAPYAGTLTWAPGAEAAMERVPFFSRGRHRLAASALARKRGLDRVTEEVVNAIGR